MIMPNVKESIIKPKVIFILLDRKSKWNNARYIFIAIGRTWSHLIFEFSCCEKKKLKKNFELKSEPTAWERNKTVTYFFFRVLSYRISRWYVTKMPVGLFMLRFTKRYVFMHLWLNYRCWERTFFYFIFYCTTPAWVRNSTVLLCVYKMLRNSMPQFLTWHIFVSFFNCANS